MSIAQAEHWLKTVVTGQPIHRDDLGDESTSGGTLRGISPATLELVPHLQRDLAQELEAAPKQELNISTPSLGLGGSRSGGTISRNPNPNLNNRTPKPPKDNGQND